ncbi:MULTISPECIES: arginine--tRNA ligase [Clostridia]|jgi:arginyl-tRNA synthetase|uniref:Arginine--tRNA ligase n=1 Tax=Butyribacter intestini TaxID=1703332 RepID=A0AAW3JPN5_9FIRM|nr:MULTISPECIES: arginine--tRNA ligase [Clostridia]MBS5365502.1 arginine--tRNA ligase [Clostridium sp.]MCQ5165860.1 arginine--tRNA ligase [Roseburia hominis]OKZ80004.1 MAG: arginine--tRNA ligase [Clostridium sp. CAG:12237_41]UYJ41798.1 MAG: arginine--tRNA ligase [Lachnospiraceae bacterium]KQC84812.1 arginine--tRNA ligase [Butyribacter intestini]
MKKVIEILQEELSAAFEKAGYDKKYAKVGVSNRPDLCQYQCNGALAAAKEYHKAPIQMANEVVEFLKDSESFKEIAAQAPGFINMSVSDRFLADYINKMAASETLGLDKAENPETIVIDYGGANVAKPLHVGHLRSAVIGESIKRTARYLGHKVIGDVHLGDWGLQIGLIITELKHRKPELVYFDESFDGEYPTEPPFTMSDLEEIYPYASGYSKEHPEYKEEAQTATAELQSGRKGYLALWQHIINVSVADLKKIYTKLNVEFDLWKKESDAQPYIPQMVQDMKDGGYAHIDQGALVVDVKEETDTKEIPPCMILKSNGATLYNTTDLATIVERRRLFDPDEIIYVVDKRQSLYFEQVFRCARKTKIIGEDVKLEFVGFGTMNGKDGKPFKTRDGGVLRLEKLLEDVNEQVLDKMKDRDMDKDMIDDAAAKISLAAIKYGDLSNQASKDYIFDVDRFTSFEGNTGPYILYTIVRTKSLLAKVKAQNITVDEKSAIEPADSKSETDVMLALTKWSETVNAAFEEHAPHKICQFVYELSDTFNKFYHENKIVTNENEKQRDSYIKLSALVGKVLETAIDLLGLEAPERM